MWSNMAAGMDALNITWGHGINSQEALSKALKSDVSMLEADVLLRKSQSDQDAKPFMAHSSDDPIDITLEEWLSRVCKSDKGIKLDFKSDEVLLPAKQILTNLGPLQGKQLWLNADIMTGPNNPKTAGICPSKFKDLIGGFPKCKVSIGWTTANGSQGYTKQMTADMALYASGLTQSVTFPVRAVLVKRSWDNLKALLEKSLSYSLTVWSKNDKHVDPDDLVFIRQNFDISRVYYDLPDWLMKKFIDRLN